MYAFIDDSLLCYVNYLYSNSHYTLLLKCLKISKMQWIRLSNGVHLEPNLTQCGMIQNVASIKQERRLGHFLKNLLILQSLEFIPLGQDANGMSTVARIVWTSGSSDGLVEHGSVVMCDIARVLHFLSHFFVSDFRVVDVEFGLFL